MLLFRAIAAALGLRLRVEGADRLPPGPCLLAAAPHRTWIDPFVVFFALPLEPRPWFLGDGEAIYRDPLRAAVVRAVGGAVPIWKGRLGIEDHIAAARAVLAAGARFGAFLERGPAVPVERARHFGAGLGYVALRTGAPIVPIVIGGTHELYLGRRCAVRFLEPADALVLAGLDAPPPVGSAAERHAAHRVVERLHELMAPHVAELHRVTEPPPPRRKRWRWLTTAFR